MPLIKSKSDKAFSKNVATEVEAKKREGYAPKKAAQIATAIAHDVRRRAKPAGKPDLHWAKGKRPAEKKTDRGTFGFK